MSYVDGFLLPVPKKNIAAYKAMAKMACKVWMEHGVLAYRECVGDDLEIKGMLSFLKTIPVKKGETVFFSWIRYKSKAHRNAVNKKVMADPRMNAMMKGKKMPFDHTRMAYGGFKAVVEG